MRFVHAILATAAAAVVIPSDYVIHEKRATPGNYDRRLEPHVRLPIRIGLKPNENARQLAEKWLMDVSHPRSEKYGQHWSREEVIDAFAPSDDIVEAIIKWIVGSGGIEKERIAHTSNKAWISFNATAEEAEQLFKTEYFIMDDGEKTTFGCHQYHLPAHLVEHVDYITPGVVELRAKSRKSVRLFPHFIIELTLTISRVNMDGSLSKRSDSRVQLRREKLEPALRSEANSTALETCDQMITHDCIRALYNIPFPDPEAEVSPNNTMGIYLLSSAYAQEDLDMFFSNFTPYIANGTAPIMNSINGGMAPTDIQHAGAEACMDLELAIPLIYPQQTTVYQVDDSYWEIEQVLRGGMFNTFLDAIDESYCTYEAYGEKGDNPEFDPVYPNEREGGYKGERMCGVYKVRVISNEALTLSDNTSADERDIYLVYER